MIDILATYRAEKGDSKLIELPENFFTQAQEAIQIMQAEETDTELERELMAQDINSSKRAIELLSDLRIKKILKGAIADAYRAKPEHDRDFFTAKERGLYEAIVGGIKEIKA